jgi:sec-independent protein translocase protein TatC
MTENQLPLTRHLEELRKSLIYASAAWIIAFLVCYGFSEQLFQFISEPVRAALPEGSSLVFINATEPFFTYLKVAALAGLLLSLPVILWQLWSFIAPGLYAHEKKLAIPFVFASTLCFGLGAFFGFSIVFPTIFTFLIAFGTGTGEINAMLSMGSYLSLSSKLLIAFGLVFELPIVIFFLARMGVVDYHWLARNRKFALLTAFLVGAVLTPPDVFSQAALALPFIILYEIGIWIARFFGKKPETEEEKTDTDANGNNEEK